MATPKTKKKTVKKLPAPKKSAKKVVRTAAINKLEKEVKKASKQLKQNLKPVPEGHSIVCDGYVNDLKAQVEDYKKNLESVAGQLHEFKKSKDFNGRPQDAQNEIVGILMQFPMNLQNVIISCSLTILKGQRTAAVDDAIELVLAKNKQVAEAELVLDMAKTCEQGFNETVTAAASKLH